MKSKIVIAKITASEDYRGYRVELDINGKEVSRKKVDTDITPSMCYYAVGKQLVVTNVNAHRMNVTFRILKDGDAEIEAEFLETGECILLEECEI